MTQQSADAVEFLAALGADMSVQVAGHGSPVARAHFGRPKAAPGRTSCSPMIAEIERREIPVYLNTRGVELLTDESGRRGGRAGAVNEEEGIEYTIHAKSVVIATGNFASNNEMVAEYDPQG